MVSVVLDNLAAGTTTEQILADYPSLSEEDLPVAYLAHPANGEFSWVWVRVDERNKKWYTCTDYGYSKPE
jgi:hypothetical protein